MLAEKKKAIQTVHDKGVKRYQKRTKSKSMSVVHFDIQKLTMYIKMQQP